MVDADNSISGYAPPEAAAWIAHLLTGTLATIIATLALALVGFAMLYGRLDIRSGLRVVVGCFVLFNAAQIANGIVGLASREDQPASSAAVPAPPVLPSAAPQFDPYAGAATPQ